MLRFLFVLGTTLLLAATTRANMVPTSDPNTLSMAQFLDAAARDVFPKDAVDQLQDRFRDLMLYMFNRYPTAQSEAQHLPAMLREGKIGTGVALDYWLERTMNMARDHAYKHIEKSYWAEQQKLEYNMLGKQFGVIEEAVHGLANLRFERAHVTFFTDFIREYMKKPDAKTATVDDFIREFKAYIKTFESVNDMGNGTKSSNNSSGDVMAYRTFRSLGPFDKFFELATKATDAFYSIQKMMGPLRTIGAFIPGIGCTLNALNTISCFVNGRTGIGALLNGQVGVMDVAKCSLHMFGSVARGIAGIKLSFSMLKDFFASIQGGGGFQAGINSAMAIASQSNINNDPWVDIGVSDFIPGHDAIANSANVATAVETLAETAVADVKEAVGAVEGLVGGASGGAIGSLVGGALGGALGGAPGLTGSITNV